MSGRGASTSISYVFILPCDVIVTYLRVTYSHLDWHDLMCAYVPLDVCLLFCSMLVMMQVLVTEDIFTTEVGMAICTKLGTRPLLEKVTSREAVWYSTNDAKEYVLTASETTTMSRPLLFGCLPFVIPPGSSCTLLLRASLRIYAQRELP